MSEPDDTDRRLRRLEAIEDARAVQARYADVIDRWDVDRLDQVFAADAVLTAGSRRFEGLAAVQGFYRAVVGGDPSSRRHFLMNVAVVDATPDRVTLAARFIYVAGTSGESVIGWGRYVDSIELREDGMRIVAKDIAVGHRGPIAAAWGPELTDIARRSTP